MTRRADWLEHRLPEAGSNWVRYWPRRWPEPLEGPAWTHLGRQSLEAVGADDGAPAHCGVTEARDWSAAASALRRLVPELDDVLYLPPVVIEGQDLRLDVARMAREGGVPVVGQCQAGQSPGDIGRLVELVGERGEVLLDLTCLVVERFRWSEASPEQLAQAAGIDVIAALYPVIAGLSDRSDAVAEASRWMQCAGLRAVRVVSLRPDPEALRRLGSGLPQDDALALFHAGDPDLRQVERQMRSRGLEVWRARPVPQGAAVGRRRAVSGVLCRIGEAWTALGRAESAAQEFFVASRWLDETNLDIDALVREDNLRIVDRVGASAAAEIAEWIQTGHSALLEELEREYFDD